MYLADQRFEVNSICDDPEIQSRVGELFILLGMHNGEQKIMVWCDFETTMEDSILHGVVVATILRKELTLFSHVRGGSKERIELSEARLRGVAAKLCSQVPHLKVHFYVSALPIVEVLEDMAVGHECLVLIAHKQNAQELLTYLPHAAFPFLFVNSRKDVERVYRKIVIPVGYLKKSKDLALWASYLGRHNRASVDLLIAREGSEADRRQVEKNVYSVERLYSKFSFPFQCIESHTPTWRLQRGALNHALGFDHALLIIAASFNTNFIDSMLGLTEKKVIAQSGDLAVLCVNSRRDFYSYCG